MVADGGWRNDEWVLSTDGALVLFEMLARRSEQEHRLTTEHKAERAVLDELETQMERTLAAPFASDYRDQLAAARERLLAD